LGPGGQTVLLANRCRAAAPVAPRSATARDEPAAPARGTSRCRL